ncbi:hypothetical protein [Novosphingobium resinovorum]|uniref:COG3650 family protein n=1 Tax=Novosphingobium resinovorum TaxID=158500 RepID=UPI002ED3774C|nr:hypothetical protein [Novosphingobium resinovorum]
MPGDPADHRPWNGITAAETVHFVGTEPFWSGEVGPSGLVYRTPENEGGQPVPASRFAGRGGVSFSGELAGRPATLVVTPAGCSDGMSDARYPYTVTLEIGDDMRRGCGWTARKPREGAEGQ